MDENKPRSSRRTVLTAAGGAAAVIVAASAKITARAASPKATPKVDGKPIPVAFLLDEGATIIDFCGPWEVLQDTFIGDNAGFELFTVAPTSAPLRASGGMRIIPDYTLDNAPPAKIIVIPAQSGARGVGGTTEKKVAWLKARHPHTELIMSVCTGAFLLARTGLFDGLSMTTHHLFYDQFRAQFPKVRLEPKRFVEHGSLMSAGGLSSGIDGALRIVHRFYGPRAAQSVAEYMEYEGRNCVYPAKGTIRSSLI